MQLLVLSPPTRETQRFSSAGVQVEHCQSKWQIFRQIKKSTPDRLLLSGPKAQIWGALAARYESLPVTIFFNHMLPISKMSYAIQRLVMRRQDRAIAVSHAVAKWTLKRYSLTPAQLDVVYPGIELGLFKPPDVYTSEIGAPIVCVVGRIRFKEKGQNLVLDIWPSILKHYPQATLQFIGEGPDTDSLQQRIRQDPLLAASVLMLGQQEDIASCLRHASLVVVPSLCEEGFGLLPVEAAALGKPSIAFASGGLLEALKDGETGLLVKTGDTDALCQAILRLFKDPLLRKAFFTAGPQFAAGFSVERQVHQFASALMRN